MNARALAFALVASGLLAQQSEIPLGLNLPNADRLQGWDMGIRFTHRFLEPARGAGKDLYGLDGGTYPGFGLDLGIQAVPGLNAQIYRTADDKTVTLALQEQLLDGPGFRLAARVERFDETVKRVQLPLGTVGISGASAQLPAEFRKGPVTLLLVPTWLTRTSLVDKALFTVGAGLKWQVAPNHSLLAEYYPRPSRLDASAYSAGGSLGYRFGTRRHRFTLLATTAPGTTAHQVLGGDYAGGPRGVNHWALAFNLVRVF